MAISSASLLALGVPSIRRLFHPLVVQARGAHTVDQRVAQFTDADSRLREKFRAAGATYLPAKVVLLGLKAERRIELYAGDTDDSLKLIAAYPVLAASGSAGPKLREGDRQVPEGVYALDSLNPNSKFHVSLRVGYPNEFDRAMAARDGRSHLGGDIMIHGGDASIGCLAMGDPAAEELFLLAAKVGSDNVKIVIAPIDLRIRELPDELNVGWRRELYDRLKVELSRLAQHRRAEVSPD